MNKAFLFDMDGVLVDSERIWMAEDHNVLTSLFGQDITDKIGDTTGITLNGVYDLAISYGATVDKDTYLRRYDEVSRSIYERAPLIKGTEKLADYLVAKNFKLGLVSATRTEWINNVIQRLPFYSKFEAVVSVNDANLPSKPAPDGYALALRTLDADPTQSVVLEDSNPGIASGKAAGCYVIGYRGHLADGYEQTGADAEAETMDEVIKIVELFDRD